jgi:hypothetical protein
MKRLSPCVSLMLGWVAACGSAPEPVGGDLSSSSGTSATGSGGTGAGNAVTVPSGTPGASSIGKGTGSSSSTTPTTFTPTANQDGKCEVVNVDTGPVVPDMLIVLDRSGSMKQQPGVDCRNGVDFLNPVTFACLGIDCTAAANANSALCGGTEVVNRWDPSVAALKAVTRSRQDRVRFGQRTQRAVCHRLRTGRRRPQHRRSHRPGPGPNRARRRHAHGTHAASGPHAYRSQDREHRQ